MINSTLSTERKNIKETTFSLKFPWKTKDYLYLFQADREAGEGLFVRKYGNKTRSKGNKIERREI